MNYAYHSTCELKYCIVEAFTMLGRQCCVDQFCPFLRSYVRATPVWDNPAHNNVRRGLFKALAANCLTAAKKGKWTPTVANELKEK